jgi:protein-tyrosine phosphatase
MAVLWRVQPAFLQAAFAEVDAAHGSLEGYFREGLGLGASERAALRHRYGAPGRT